MIPFLIGFLTPIVAAAVVWYAKRLTFIHVEKRQQVVQITVWPGEWVIACSQNVRDFEV